MNPPELSDGVSSFHIDFQKNISFPKLSCQESYYSSKLTTYAFGIHSGESRNGTVYVWPETTAPKHPDTLLSCLHCHLNETEDVNRKWNIFWADNTRSQNKNYTVVLFFENMVSSGERERIDYKFLIAGHSFGQVDRNAGRCEKVLRSESHIETPTDIVSLVNNSLSPGITWIEMEREQFKCYSKWLRKKYDDQRKDKNGQPFRFSEMVHFNFGIGERVDPVDGKLKSFRHPGVVWMRKTLDPRENPIEVDFRKKPHIDLRNQDLTLLNRRQIELSDKKSKDLLSLCKYLSPSAQTYYRSLVGRESANA